jgi:putative transposase
VATAPCTVWSWDISYLRTTVKGRFFYLYLMLDVWSRKVVGWRVEEKECTELASELLSKAVATENADPTRLVVHADNGGPMKGCTMKAMMEKLGVLSSFSRPSVSNDNPFSEAFFRTLKYCPEYPRRPFETVDEACKWVERFVCWYNTKHLHSGIGFVTPDDRHARRDAPVLAQRRAVYAAAYAAHPERWSTCVRPWSAPAKVRLNPDQTPPSHAMVA